MLGRKRREEEEVRAFLGKGAEFTGKLMFNGSVRIDGDFKGDIFGNGTLVIGEGAELEADIRVDNLLISGEIRGTINVKKSLKIYSTGRLMGDVNTAPSRSKTGPSRGDLPYDPERGRGPYLASGSERGREKR
jgi:cytoskeletal protein CcmA (bactofilin family)